MSRGKSTRSSNDGGHSGSGAKSTPGNVVAFRPALPNGNTPADDPPARKGTEFPALFPFAPWMQAWSDMMQQAFKPSWPDKHSGSKAPGTVVRPGAAGMVPLAATDSDLDGPSSMDRMLHAALGRATLGLSPAALSLAYADWSAHLALAPGKHQQLWEKAWRKWARFGIYAIRAARDPETAPCIEPLPQDRRFRDPAWQSWPFNLTYQSFLLTQQWWHNATRGIRGVAPHHAAVVSFTARQLLDLWAPSNFLATTPELIELTSRERGGESCARRDPLGGRLGAGDCRPAAGGRRRD